MLTRMRKRMKGQKGFTLIELLVVIIIIAILAAIAIPTFLGQRQKAQDAAAKSLVRNAMTTIESAYVDLRAFTTTDGTDGMSVAVLEAIEPSISFVYGAAAATAPTALTSANEVNYLGSGDEYQVGTVSASTRLFGVGVNKSAQTVAGGATYEPGIHFFVDGAATSW